MTDTSTTALADTVDTHLAAYCEPDPTVRATLLAQVWSPAGVLVDPPFDGTGPEAIAALVDVLLQHYPAHTFRRTTEVDAHHTFARYGWALVAPEGATAVAGTDVVEVDDAGRLVRIVGFFGDLTPRG